ncbi:hypothetical protein Pcinc_017121 [Petrolisthes cinctipes]|uniref:Reverse transcriptase RNase H-like domain-containing protein n=1 Tax=Petrolisthes cinctipes TaxID=88211 RepID=A0AAE1FQX8_PETCI|nr:hypothetical protein Pcinc_017121 [Petrolisthes cinctipes]
MVLAGSRFTTPVESKYSPVEGEALAVTYSLEKSKYFVLGYSDLIVAVDHAPLVKILGDRKLEEIHNTLLLKLKEKTLAYKFTIIHVPGEWHKGPADACSRYPTFDPCVLGTKEDVEKPCKNYINNLLAELRVRDSQLVDQLDIETSTQTSIVVAFHMDAGLQAITWEKLKQATDGDPKLKHVYKVCNLEIPAFTRGKKQLSMIEIQDTREIASQRIHVEGVIGHLRNKYTMLQDTHPLTMLQSDDSGLTCLDKCVRVACALVNMCPSVVPLD